MRHPALVAAAFAATLLASPFAAQAQFAKPEDAIKYRQGAFTVMAAHFGRIGAMVNGRVPYDAKAAAENAAVVVAVSKLPMVAFGPGTDTGRDHRAAQHDHRDNAPQQRPVLIHPGHREEREQHQPDEDVVDSEGFLDEITG